MKKKLFCLVSFLSLSITTVFADNLSLQRLDRNSIFTGTANEAIYILTNNSMQTVSSRIASYSPTLHINYRLSTCGNQLPAKGMCKLVLGFNAPKKVGQVTEYINIAQSDNTINKLSLAFNVINKTKITQTNSSLISWTPTKGPYGGYITDIEALPSNPKTLFASVFWAGIYKSTNGGKNWKAVNNGLTDLFCQNLLINKKTIYAIMMHGLFKSTNLGASWTCILTGNVSQIIADGNKLYVANGSNIYISKDEGTHWTITKNFPNGLYAYSVFAKDNVIYAGTSPNGFYKSIDNGNSWKPMNNGIPTDKQINNIIEVNNALFATSPNYDGTSAIYKSTNKGATWYSIGGDLGFLNVTSIAASGDTLYVGTLPSYNSNFTNRYGVFKSVDADANWTLIDNGLNYNLVSHVTVTKSTIYAATIGGLFQSINHGDSWQSINNGINGEYITSLVSLPNGTIFAGTLLSGVFKSKNGSTWTTSNDGFDFNTMYGALIREIATDKNKDILYALCGVNLYKSIDEGQTWYMVQLPNLYGDNAAWIVVNNSVLYFGVAPYFMDIPVYASSNGGISWGTLPTQNLPLAKNPLNMIVVGKTIYLNYLNSIFENTIDSQGAWEQLVFPAIDNASFIQNIYSVDSHTPNDLLYTGINGFNSSSTGRFFGSSDGGQTWTRLDAGMPSNANIFSFLAQNSIYLTATNNYGVFISTDFGANWTPANTGLPTGALALASNGKYIFVGTRLGIYKTPISSLSRENF